MYEINEPLDKYIAKPIAQAWVDYVPTVVQKAVEQLRQQHRRPVLGRSTALLQGKLDKAGNDIGRVHDQHRVRLRWA